MRTIELLFSLLTIFAAILFLFPGFKTRVRYQVITVVLVLVGAAQVVLEGFRWQLWPLFIAAGLLTIITGRNLLQKDSRRMPRGLVIAALVLGVLSLAAGWLVPVPKPYPISGPYQVGTVIFPLKDDSRTEIYAAEPNQPREIMVQIWYPAAPTDENRRALWMEDIAISGPAIADYMRLPSFSLSHLENLKSNAYLDAPVIPGGEQFPVLILSHGWSGFKEVHIFQAEEMASHGYVVAAINFTYVAAMTVFPDGRQIPRNDDALPEGVSEEEYDLASNRLVRQWAGDIGFLLDELDALNQSEANWLLSGRLDLSRVGVLGHSTGGGATVEFCGVDARCKAALMMDLWAEPVSASIISAGLSQPYLLMHSEAWANVAEPSPNFQRIGELVQASSGEGFEFLIEGTQHWDFTSLPMLSPLAISLGLKGPIPGIRGLEIIDAYTLAFFNQALLGQEEALLGSANSPFPEVQFGLRP